MFKDVKGRQLKVGDLVLYNLGSLSSKYCYGLIYSESKVVLYSGSIQEVRKDSFCYLIDNPDDYEMTIKCEIAENFALKNSNKLKESVSQSKLSSNYHMGDVLVDSNGCYLYLGSICLSNSNYNFSGHGYIFIPSPYLKDTSSLLYYLNNCFSHNVILELPDVVYGSAKGSYSLKLLKRKSTRYHKIDSSHDISSINKSILSCWIDNKLRDLELSLEC